MLLLNENIIKELYHIDEAITHVKEVLLAKSNEQIENPLRTVIEFPEQKASVLYMPSADHKKKYMTMKSVTIFPENVKKGRKTTQGVTLLADATNGEHVCLMDASYLTRLRTGALSGIATDLYAREDAEVLTCIGTGGMAFEQVLGVLEVRNIKKINLVNRTLARAEQFKEKLIQFGIDPSIDITIIPYEEKAEAIKIADVVNCSTRSEDPVLLGKEVTEGTHVNGVGSYLPHMREVDHDFILKANKIIVDDFHGATEEAGELIYANEQEDWSYDKIHGELMDAVVEKVSARERPNEITFFKSVGSAYFDLAVATGVYEKAVKEGKGVKVDL
mgnify:CR=1 FL=1